MKPLELIMQAFGTFARMCRIDFEPFEKSGIFLITGETGAGKTTIFDAICFALYGTASGEKRKPGMFRSEYAKPTQQTAVQLRFSCGEKTYLVQRTPRQQGYKSNGEMKKNLDNESAFLWLCPGEAQGNVLVCEGAERVNREIISLTGIDGDQFRQIVMIAQGEFQKFLLEDSKKKGEILRQLFHTQNCEKIQKILKLRLAAQKQRVTEQETRILTLLHQAKPADAFQQSLYAERLERSGAGAAENLCEMLETAAAELRERADAREKQLQVQQKALEQLLLELEQGRQHNAVLQHLQQAVQLLTQEQARLKMCDTSARTAAQNAERLPELQEKATLLQHSLPAYEKAAQLSARESALQKKTALQKQLCAKAKLEWEQTDTSCKHLSLELETYADTAVDHTRLTHQIENDTNRQNAVLTLQQMFAEYAAAQAVRDKQKQQAQQAEERYFTREKPAYDQIERQFFQSMAGNLARRLEPQKPCPVCGALEHPHPAACTEDTVTEEQFQKARESQQRALQNLETQKHETARREEHCRMLESQRQKQLEQCGMAATADAEEVRQLLEQLQMSIRENQQKLAALENRLNEEKRKRAVLKQQQEHLPGLQTAYENSRAALEQLEQEYAGCAAERKQCQSGLLYASLSEAEKQWKLLQNNIARLETAYQTAADALQKQKETVASQQKIVQHLQETAQDVPGYDVAAAEQRLAAMRSEKAQTEKAFQLEQQQQQQCSQTAKAVRKAHSTLQKDSEQCLMMEQLDKMLGGQQGKREKISFERYVQAYYFSRVLQKANLKLYQLSGGRYQFRRRQEETDGRIASGLNLDVLDQYTGKTRFVETLSGGETFLASLALALGLSDTVQQQSGSIRMDAMFIDEGFGSLDSTALDNAVQVLQQLSDHQRLIGIISHVSELTERFDAQLQVQKGENGSHITCQYA